MAIYRVVELTTGRILVEKKCRDDQSASDWLDELMEQGTISGIAVTLQRRVMTDEEADALPPFINGQKQSAWVLI